MPINKETGRYETPPSKAMNPTRVMWEMIDALGAVYNKLEEIATILRTPATKLDEEDWSELDKEPTRGKKKS